MKFLSTVSAVLSSLFGKDRGPVTVDAWNGSTATDPHGSFSEFQRYCSMDVNLAETVTYEARTHEVREFRIYRESPPIELYSRPRQAKRYVQKRGKMQVDDQRRFDAQSKREWRQARNIRNAERQANGNFFSLLLRIAHPLPTRYLNTKSGRAFYRWWSALVDRLIGESLAEFHAACRAMAVSSRQAAAGLDTFGNALLKTEFPYKVSPIKKQHGILNTKDIT